MLKPTNDPIRAARRKQATEARTLREALATAGTQPFQAVRKILALVQAIYDLLIRMPLAEVVEDVQDGFGLSDVASSAWKTVASVSLPSPSDKSRVVVSAAGQGAVLDTTSGGLTTSECRLLINGVASAVIPAAKDAGASVVNNVLTVNSVTEITPLPPTVTVQFQMRALNPSAFPASPSNIANLNVYAGYSVV